MEGTKDIKNFTKFPSLSDDDLLLGSKTSLGGTDASITVANFKKQVVQDVKPSIVNGYWWVDNINTGVLATGRTPKFRKTPEGLWMKYEDQDDTAYILLIPMSDLAFTFDDLSPEQVEELKLKFTDLTDAEKEALRGAAFTYDMFTPEQLADLRLTWDKLTPDQKNSLKGDRGYSAFEVWTQQVGNEAKTVDDYLAWLRQPATDAAKRADEKMVQISENVNLAIGETNKAKDAANRAAEAANTAAGNVQDGEDGKTPSLEIGTVQGGTDPAASVTPAGTDATGNPKYKINLTLPAGANGLPPVLEQGTVTTGEPGTDALASLIANGQTVAGNPKYLLNLTLPRGQQGLPGTGSGNVSADGTGLLIGKKYLFVPSANGTTTGTFVEYVAPTIPEQVQPDWNATAGKAAILNKPTIPSKTSQLSNDSNFATKTDIGNHNTSAVAHSDIRQALSDVEAIARGKSRAKVFDTVAALDVWLGVSANVTTLQVGDNFYIKALDVPDYWWDGTAKQPIEAEKVDLTNYVQKEAGKGLFSGSYNDLSNKPTIPTVPGVATSTVDGLMSSADKRNLDAAVVPKNITTATTLTNLSIANYSIKVTLSSASALSFASTPAEGWECMIDIKNVKGGGSGPITQPLPNASGWQCDDTSITIAAGKIASISVRYIHGTYVVIAKGN